MKKILLKSYFFWRELFFKILSPPFCESCHLFLSARTILCVTCRQKIKSLAVHNLKVNSRYQVAVYALGAYQEPLKTLILSKMRSYQLLSRYLGEQIYFNTPFANLPCDFVVPIPLHWTRFGRRGYNQSTVMAQRLVELRPEIALADILKRTRATKYQTNLTKLARSQNLKQAFVLKNIDRVKYCDKNLILIDDVFTSGATVLAAVRVLQTLKPKSIAIVVAARAI